MNEFLKNTLEQVKGTTHISDIPIEEFTSIDELNQFVQFANKQNCGVTLNHETSNFHQGVVVQIFDKETCTVKKYLNL